MLTVLVILLVALGVVVCLVRPMYAVVPVLVLFPLEQLLQAYVPFLLFRPWVINVAVGVLALLAAMRAGLSGRTGFRGVVNPVLYLVALFYFIVVFGLIYSRAQADATDRLVAGLPYWALLLVLMPMLMGRVEDFGRLIIPFMLTSVVIMGLLLLSPAAKVINGRLVVDFGGFGEQEGSSNPLALATLGGLVAIVAGLNVSKKRSVLSAALRYAAVGLGLGLALLTGSRGQTIAAVFVIVVCTPLARKIRDVKQFVLSVVVIAIIGISLLAALQYLRGETSIDRWDAGSIGDGLMARIQNYKEGLGALFQYPIAMFVGMGTGSFTAIASGDEPYPHNLVVETMISHGAIGIFVLGMIYIVIARKSVELWRLYEEDSWERSVVAILIGVAIYHTLLSLKQGSYVGHPTPFWWLLVVARIAYSELGAHRENALFAESEYGEEQYEDEEWIDE